MAGDSRFFTKRPLKNAWIFDETSDEEAVAAGFFVEGLRRDGWSDVLFSARKIVSLTTILAFSSIVTLSFSHAILVPKPPSARGKR